VGASHGAESANHPVEPRFPASRRRR
jgi:hypothetical protein